MTPEEPYFKSHRLDSEVDLFLSSQAATEAAIKHLTDLLGDPSVVGLMVIVAKDIGHEQVVIGGTTAGEPEVLSAMLLSQAARLRRAKEQLEEHLREEDRHDGGW